MITGNRVAQLRAAVRTEEREQHNPAQMHNIDAGVRAC